MVETLLLLPAPRQLVPTSGTFSVKDQKLILLRCEKPQALRYAAARLQAVLREHLDLTWEVAAGQTIPLSLIALTLQIAPSQEKYGQGYELSIEPQGITITGHAEAGVFYAICTLIQIIEQCGAELPCLYISDWPDFPARGVMLDISRDKVPSMETIMATVDMLAGWKINQLQLYTEHTFAYRSHPEVWADASPFTSQEMMDLDAYCIQRHIELVPNQNSFGHMHRWLKHPRYQPLAEVTDGFEAPWGHVHGAFSICPIDPESLDLLDSLYDELLPNFSSRMFNVGCDETFDLGQGRSRDACLAQGTGRVYLDFLLKIYEKVKARGYTMQFWGDIILKYPEFIPVLPKDVIALEWGYEADYPFAEHCARFAAAGIPFYVCPGTSTWMSIAGRTANALGNLRNAAENGLKFGAAGYLITDWGDNGHWQALPVSYLGFAAGAAYSWAYQANCHMDVPLVLSRHAFRDPAGVMGRVAYDLGDIHQFYSVVWPSSSIMAAILQAPFERIRNYIGVTAEGFCDVLEAIDRIMMLIQDNRMERPDRDLILKEYELAARLLRHACWRGLLALGSAAEQAYIECQRLEQDMQEIMEDFRAVWLARNRPGGLEDSLARFVRSRQDYLALLKAG